VAVADRVTVEIHEDSGVMDSRECRERFGRLIIEETSALGELAVLLEREHQHLVADDVGALESAIRERHPCVARIIRVDEERRALCRQTGQSLDLQGLERLLRWCDPEGTLAAGWERCSAAAAECRKLNDRNGALVSARLKHVQARLGALLNGARESVTYGRGGGYNLVNVGRVVATEA
jgi:flagellar biosynthesis/type III secretory pathway chaperone